MKGLELAQRYWSEVCEPVIRKIVPEALPAIAAGLAGEGSECMGYDDEISKDHDWGPGFCIWLGNDEYSKYADILSRIYAALPDEFLGYKRAEADVLSSGRTGVININVFYSRFLGRNTLPASLMDWMTIDEEGLFVATNGKVFYDGKGEFTRVRNTLLNYYPEDVRLKKLAGRCAKIAQSGQYNYYRCLKRGDKVAAFIALSEFVDSVQAFFFLMNKKYRPYYKWSNRMLKDLGGLEKQIAEDLAQLIAGDITQKGNQIESICEKIATSLKKSQLSISNSDFLLEHAKEIQIRISDSEIRCLPLMLV